jgi:transcription elongation factor GreA
MRTPQRKSEHLAQRKSAPFVLTQSGLDEYKAEVAKLEKSLPELIKAVEHTKSHGDLSENAAYQDAKHTLRRTNGRILKMKNKIKRAIIIEKGETDTVQVGSTIVVESGGKKSTFELLGSHESDPAKGRISDTSPLGKLLLGKKVGDEVVLKLESGAEAGYTIIEVK